MANNYNSCHTGRMDFIERFRASLRIPTFWPAGTPAGDRAAEAVLLRFQDFLVENFPAFHKATERWALSPYAVVYRWPGTETEAASGAVLILSHYDVVAAETEKWTVDPFGAEMKDGYIYGRGSLDMKHILMSIMEAAETLCVSGFKPKKDVWFAFGGDEERTGILGAVETAKWFAQRGQRFEWVLDEGTPIGEDQIKGVDSPLALISIEEKGYLSLELTVAQEPGHSSRPPKTQAAAVLGRALCRIAAKPFPFNLTPTVESFFRQISPMMPGIKGFVMRHARALGRLFFIAAGTTPTVAAMLRTTVAMTRLEGSAADNVMPSAVRAIINLRLLPPWTIDTAANFIRSVINDERVSVKTFGLAANPSPAKQDLQHSGWKRIETALAESWPGIPLLPFVMVATTDSRHFMDLTEGVYRFSPHKLNPGDLNGLHGHDERITEENLRKGLRFYSKLFEGL